MPNNNVSSTKRFYGWKRGLPSIHHEKYSDYYHIKTNNPARVDLRSLCPAVYDQGQLGSCTANASAGITEFLQMKQGIKAYVPSRLFIYYNERVIDGDTADDNGSSLTNAVKVLKAQGAPPESLWWYNTEAFAVKPSQSVYTAGKKLVATNAYALDNTNLDALRTCLASGFPIIGGFTVYESFESDAVAKSGIAPLPKKSEQAVGGHAIMIVGYDDAKNIFIVRNSWGNSWGLAGYFTVGYDYFTNKDLADDFWTIKKVIAS